MSIDLLALISIVALSVSLVATLSGYVRLQNKLRRFEEEEEAIKMQARHKAGKILEHAQQAAFEIANEAVIRAETTQNTVKEKLQEVASKQLLEYQKMIHAASGDVEHEAVKMIELKMDEEWEKVKKEIDLYKSKRSAEIDEQAKEVIKKVSKKIIGKTIDPSTHSQLVLESLEQAKNEYGF